MCILYTTYIYIFHYFKGRKCSRKKVLRFLRFWLESQKFIPAKCRDISEPQKYFPRKIFIIFTTAKVFFQNFFIIIPTAKVFSKKISLIIRREIPPTESLFCRSSLIPISMSDLILTQIQWKGRNFGTKKYFREDLLCRSEQGEIVLTTFLFFNIKIIDTN